MWEYDPSSKTVSIYLNGVSLSLSNYVVPGMGDADNYLSSFPSNVYVDSSAQVLIGGGHPETTSVGKGSFVGKLDEVRVYGKILSEKNRKSLVDIGNFNKTSILSMDSRSCIALAKPDYIKVMKRTKLGENDDNLSLSDGKFLGHYLKALPDLDGGVADVMSGMMLDAGSYPFIKILDTDDTSRDGGFEGEFEINRYTQDENGNTLGLSQTTNLDGEFGSSMGVLRDLGNDGHPDLIIGVPNKDLLYVVKMKKESGQRKVSSSYKIRFDEILGRLGESGGHFPHFGTSLAVLDDSNPKAIKLAVGHGIYDGGGEVFIFTIDDTLAEGSKVTGTPVKLSKQYSGLSSGQDYFGYGSLESIGDLDNNGYKDLAIGVSYDDIKGAADNNDDTGVLHIVFMGADDSVVKFTRITRGEGGLPPGSVPPTAYFSHSISLIKERTANSQSIEIFAGTINAGLELSYILTIGQDGLVKDYKIISNSVSGFIREDFFEKDLGKSLGSAASPGDVNGDGSNDLFIGSMRENSSPNASDSVGAIYFFGLSSPSEHVKKGSYTFLISKEPSVSWDKLLVGEVDEIAPSGTSIKYKVLDSSCNNVFLDSVSSYGRGRGSFFHG